MALFSIAISLTLAQEGGFQKNPKDRANWTSGIVGVGTLVGTKYGITTLDMPGVDIENLAPEQASDYYSQHYWKPLYSQIVSQEIASKLFDLGVLFGVGIAVKVLQGILNIIMDGVFGPQTLEAINAVDDEDLLLSQYKSAFHARATAIAMNNPNDLPDLADWHRRIDL